MDAFKIYPRHWYDWINPFFWRRAKIVKAMLNSHWDHGGKEEFEKKYRNAVLYGETDPNIDKNA